MDPGWKGPLRFALYNAGPSPIHIQQGMQLILLWIANLDKPSEKYRTKAASEDDFIRMVNRVSGPVNSGYDVSDRIAALELRQTATKEQVAMITGVGLALAVGVFLMLLRLIMYGELSAPPSEEASSLAKGSMEVPASQTQEPDSTVEPVPMKPEL